MKTIDEIREDEISHAIEVTVNRFFEHVEFDSDLNQYADTILNLLVQSANFTLEYMGTNKMLTPVIGGVIVERT